MDDEIHSEKVIVAQVSKWLGECFEFNENKKGKFWQEKILVSKVVELAELNFEGQIVTMKTLGKAMKEVFPGVKRQHSNGPYSYYGLAPKNKIHLVPDSLENEDSLNIAPKTLQKTLREMKSNNLRIPDAPPPVKSVACHVVEASPYNCPPNQLFKIPKEKFINRALLHPVEGENFSLGERAFAIVHKMHYKKIPVAVKQYKEHHRLTLTTVKERVIREARTMISISPHESIPILFGKIVHSHPFSLVMQLCSRQNDCLTILKLVQGMGEKLVDKELVRILAQLAAALHHIHLSGFLHNDLKLDNVALIKSQTASTNRQWVPMILDFGEATLLSESVKKRYSLFHSHIDPLVNSGVAVHSVSSDVFSLGVIIRRVADLVTESDLRDNLLQTCAICKSDSYTRPNAKAIALHLKALCT